MRRLDVLNALAERVTDLRATHTLRVAIDGIDAAGKTTLADELALVLRAHGRPVIRASIDGFHQPRAVRLHRGSLSPEGYYLDSFDYAALRDVLLLPLGPGGSSAYRPAVFDYHTDQPRALPEERAPDPEILNPHDAIVRITSTAICGSDLHLYDGYIPAMLPGDILGHEFMGEVVEVGPEVHRIHVGDRVVVAFPIACGHCFFCSRELYSLCDNTNPHAAMVEKLWGYSPAGIFGYSQLLGGYAGGQAEFARVPFADVGMQVIPDGLSDEQVLFLSDILPTGYMAAEHCNIHAGDVIAVFGCGPVGQFAIQSARLLGASRAIAIDFVPERLLMAARHGGAETIDASQTDVVDQLKLMTGGRGPDAVIDAVGMEAHGFGAFGLYDRVKQSMLLENDRGFVLRQAILGCRKGGTLSIPGVYSEFTDKVPIGALMNKGLTVRTGQTHVQRYMGSLLERIQRGELDPTFIITHKLPLDDAPHGYSVFKHKREGCVKVVLKP